MNVKGLLYIACSCFISYTTVGQRVKRKGTTPIELNRQTMVAKNENPFTITQVQGKWQEYDRMGIQSSKKEEFADTLMLKIAEHEGEVREGMTMNMQGEAVIENGKNLNVAGDSYVVQSVSEQSMLLNDGQYLRTMQKVKNFYLETVGKDSVKKLAYDLPNNILLSNIKGKWTVYRREAKPGTINSNTELVKSFSVTKDSTQNIALGELVLYRNDILEKIPCRITLKENQLQVDAGSKQWVFITYKADNDEFVFGKENEVLNFAKRL